MYESNILKRRIIVFLYHESCSQGEGGDEISESAGGMTDGWRRADLRGLARLSARCVHTHKQKHEYTNEQVCWSCALQILTSILYRGSCASRDATVTGQYAVLPGGELRALHTVSRAHGGGRDVARGGRARILRARGWSSYGANSCQLTGRNPRRATGEDRLKSRRFGKIRRRTGGRRGRGSEVGGGDEFS